jgi:hypothetical protein
MFVQIIIINYHSHTKQNMLPNEDLLPTKDFYGFNFYNIAPEPLAKGSLGAKIGIINNTPLTEELNALLNKILQAIQIPNLEAAMLFELSPTQPAISLSQAQSQTPDTNWWVIFGLSAQSVGWQFELSAPLYQTIHWQGKKIIFADALQAISLSTELKKKLWGALQQLNS